MIFEELLKSCAANNINVCSDSRKVEKGDIFVAISGTNEDGAKYIPKALELGASYIVCSEKVAIDIDCDSSKIVIYNESREALWKLAQARFHTSDLPIKIIGVTGTNGKTTCSYLLEKLYQENGYKVGVIGTVSYRWPGYSEPAALTTPDSLQIHSMLSQMYKAGVNAVIMEVSSHSLAQKRVDGISFNSVGFTNLTQDHLDFHKDMNDYFKIKARLFNELAKNSFKVINVDDKWGQKLFEMNPDAFTYGLNTNLSSKKSLKSKVISSGTQGSSLEMTFNGNTWNIDTPLVGEFNVYNLLCAQALALASGMSEKELMPLAKFSGVPGRLEKIVNKDNLNVFVDYAHTPDALINVLNALRGVGFEKIVTVFGCGGNRDKTKRPLMGQAVAELSDIAVLTSDNPRFEDPEAIINDVLPGLSNAKKVIVEKDRRLATEKALSLISKNDALLIAGKGHEDYQIINGVKHHYSDQEVVRELLQCI